MPLTASPLCRNLYWLLDQRCTYALMQCFIRFTSSTRALLLRHRQERISGKSFRARSLDRPNGKKLPPGGFEAGRKPAEVSGLPRLFCQAAAAILKNRCGSSFFSSQKFYQQAAALPFPADGGGDRTAATKPGEDAAASRRYYHCRLSLGLTL